MAEHFLLSECNMLQRQTYVRITLSIHVFYNRVNITLCLYNWQAYGQIDQHSQTNKALRQCVIPSTLSTKPALILVPGNSEKKRTWLSCAIYSSLDTVFLESNLCAIDLLLARKTIKWNYHYVLLTTQISGTLWPRYCLCVCWAIIAVRPKSDTFYQFNHLICKIWTWWATEAV